MSKYLRAAPYVTGNKYRLLPDILPHLLVEGRNTFIDLFGGSGCVTINVNETGHFDNILYNELDEHIFGLQNYLLNNDNDFCIVSYLNKLYSKGKTDYLSLVKSYNKEPCYEKLFLLQCRSFSNGIRFDKKGKFDKPWGDRAPFFLERMKEHQRLLKGVKLWNGDFREVCDEALVSGKGNQTVIYIDSPYYLTNATYNEKGGWTQQDNTDLLSYVEKLIEKGFKVVMSNVYSNRGKVHQQLIDWCECNKDKVEVHHLDIDYGNSSFHKSTDKTDEVLLVSK